MLSSVKLDNEDIKTKSIGQATKFFVFVAEIISANFSPSKMRIEELKEIYYNKKLITLLRVAMLVMQITK